MLRMMTLRMWPPSLPARLPSLIKMALPVFHAFRPSTTTLSIFDPSTLSMAMHERKVSMTRLSLISMLRNVPHVAVPNLMADAELRISQFWTRMCSLMPFLW